MRRFRSTVLALAIALAPSIALADTTPAKAAAGKTETTAEAAKADSLKRGAVAVPIEVSPFFKPQLGLAMPRM